MRARAVLGAVTLAAASCGPGTGATSSGLGAPVNACPAHPCSAYEDSAVSPSCGPGGVCEVPAVLTGLILTVSLSEDSYFAPGQTFAIPFAHLNDTTSVPATCVPAPPLPCANLPGYGIVQGAYLVTPQEQSPAALDWNLGNPGVSTALPVQVTYRALWPPGAAVSGAVDAATLGLPLDPMPAAVVVDTSSSRPPGPGLGNSIGYQANLQPAIYEATVQPDPPFDAAFPPDVKRVTVAAGSQNDVDMLAYDTTVLETGGAIGRQIPTFALSRVGGLVGWTSYLRDPTTLRRISSLATLGANTMAVSLPTNHHPADGDALTDAELVIVPPDGVPVPTYKVAAQGGQFSEAQAYPTLATAAKVSGTVVGLVDSKAVQADLFFEAQAIYLAGLPPPINTANFEYTSRASARIDSTGASTFSVTLPSGQYQLTVRPLDTQHQVTVMAAYEVDPTTGAPPGPLLVDAQRPVQGQAFVADGRYLAGATIEAVPVSCAVASSSTLCLPREASTTCLANGSFALALDPGGYVLRVQPQAGTRLPWVTQPLAVGATPVIVPPIAVPVPMHAPQQLLDPLGNPIVAAVVRVFELPAVGPAVEVGQALTDATGTYDLYLGPSTQ